MATVSPDRLLADASMECSIGHGSQVAIGACVSEANQRTDAAVQVALGFARNAAKELDEITGRRHSENALNAAQSAWSTYRDTHCAFVGTTFGGGSGTGIAIGSCRVELGRARISELMNYAR